MSSRVLIFLIASCAAAADWTPIPDGGESMFPDDSITALRPSGSQIASNGIIAVEGMPFSRALRLEVRGPFRNPWDVQILGTTTGDVKAGDVVLLSLFARGSSTVSETGEATASAYLQRNSGDFIKVATMPFTTGQEWQQFMLPVRIGTTLGPGQHNFTIFLGYYSQTIEIGGVSLINYRDKRTLADLPRTKITWPGSEPDAPWRAEAAERIDRIRKADVEIRVTGADGQPVAGAEVRLKQKRHEFGFGSAVAADGINASNSDGDRYREVIRSWFNKAVLENDLKWPNWEQNRNKALGAIDWLRSNGLTVRGHNLVWPSWNYLPSDVRTLADRPDALRARVMKHIEDEVATTKGTLVEWDVVNEPWTNTDLQKVLGDGEMAEWFKRARDFDDAPVLYINDYSILSGGGLDKAHQDGYFGIISNIIDAGAPLGGIGMQGHFGAQLTSTPKIWQILDRFAQFQKDIQITEFDIDVDDEDVQGAYTRDFMTAVFAHPSVSGFMMWGFWEGRHWKPKAAMFRRDWTVKPNGLAFQDLVYNQWWTNANGTTAEDGSWKLRAFKGEYEVEVTSGEQKATKLFTLPKDGASVSISLP